MNNQMNVDGQENPSPASQTDNQTHVNYQERKNELHAKIMKVTMTIREQHPELTKYLDEMQDTIPDERNPEVVLMDLKKYHDSLCDILAKYEVEHPGPSA